MQTTINIDKQSASEWNALIDSLLSSEGCSEALNIAIASESIWNLFLKFRCSGVSS